MAIPSIGKILYWFSSVFLLISYLIRKPGKKKYIIGHDYEFYYFVNYKNCCESRRKILSCSITVSHKFYIICDLICKKQPYSK